MYNFVGNFFSMYNWTSVLWIGETIYGNPIFWQQCQKILNVDLELQITNRAIVQDVITSHDSYFCVDISVFLSFCFFQWHVSGELKNEELCPDFGSLLMIVCWAFLLLLMWMSSFACLHV